MKTQEETETATFHCLAEENEWEGETWYHYFLDEPGVYDILSLIQEDEANDFVDLETETIKWFVATHLTNIDEGEYMQRYWFGKLTDLEGLKQATQQDLYKGGIRKFGEELFTHEDDNEEATENV